MQSSSSRRDSSIRRIASASWSGVTGGAAGKPAERFGGQVPQSGVPREIEDSVGWEMQGADEHRSERIRHTRSEERRSLLGGPRLRGMARGRWGAWAPKIRLSFSAAPLAWAGEGDKKDGACA